MQNLALDKYLQTNRLRLGRKSSRGGLLGITPVVDTPRSKIKFICILPSCLDLPSRRFASAVDAASYYNEMVVKHFGQEAVLCDIAAAYQLDNKNAKHLS